MLDIPLLFIYVLTYLFICHLVPAAAAACVKHPAGHATIIYLFFIYTIFIYHLVPVEAEYNRYPADNASHFNVICYLSIICYSVPAAAGAGGVLR